MFREGRYVFPVRAAVLGAVLLACPCGMLAQRGAGGHVGGGMAGGGGLSGGGKATGLDVKDDLKGFHAALAMQATSQQIIDYNLMVKSTEVARTELQSLLAAAAKENNSAELAARDKGFGQALEATRNRNNKFLEGLSDQQKSGLKELVKRLTKTDSELAQQAKALDDKFEETKTPGPQIAGSGKPLETTLISFQTQQIDLGKEMSIGTASDSQNAAIRIPPVKNSMNVANQPVAVTTSGTIAKGAKEEGENTFKFELTTDMSDLQQNITEVLRGQLDKSDPCGEQIAVQSAVLTPSEPAILAVVNLHYERWACFGRNSPNEMAEGNGTAEVKLTLAVGKDGGLRLDPKIDRVEAEGLMGELLRSGSLGETVRDKIAEAIFSTVLRGSDYKTILPFAAQGEVTLRRVEFEGSGPGQLSAVLDGGLRLSADSAAALNSAFKSGELRVADTKAQSSAQPSSIPPSSTH
jgi:hypothetical protein